LARISQRLYRIVAARADYCCEYCLLPQLAEAMDLTADHIIPKSEGGKTEVGNLALACMGCNAHKWTSTRARDPFSGRLVPIIHPRHDRWSEHFRFSLVDPALLEGSTAKGRATIELLDMNGPRLVLIRRWLMLANLYPPPGKGFVQRG
jgi:hypothetical protein